MLIKQISFLIYLENGDNESEREAPDPSCVVLRSRYGEQTVGRYGDAGHRAEMTFHRRMKLVSIQLPHVHQTIQRSLSVTVCIRILFKIQVMQLFQVQNKT